MQSTFDKMVAEFSKSSTVDEAIVEAKDCMCELTADLSTVFLYENQNEMLEKEKMVGRCITVEKCSKKQESFVNANFAMQGIKQLLSGNPIDRVTVGCWKLIEARGLFQTILDIIPTPDAYGDVENMKCSEEGDDDDDDDDTELKITMSLQFLCLLYRLGLSIPERIHNPQIMYEITTERMQSLCESCENEITEPSIVVAFLDLFALLFTSVETREKFTISGGISLLDLAKRVNSKHEFIPKMVDHLKSTYF